MTVNLSTPLHHALPAVVVHTALRREFRLAGPLVRSVERGDSRRATVIAEHLDFLLRGLHHHHQLEDDLIWPVLRRQSMSEGDASQHLTVEDWATIGRRAEAGQLPHERTVAFGMLQHDGDPEVVRSMLSSAPLPARLLVPWLARRAYRRRALAVYGTAHP